MNYITETYIKKQIYENEYKLLSQVEVSDEMYSELIAYVSVRVKNLSFTTVHIDLMLSLGLVQIAIRHYKEGRFWPCFMEEIGEEIPSTKTNFLGQIFYKTIKYYDLFCPRQDGDGEFQYVEYIKAHAFVTDYYINGFFDFSYAYYENNLFRQLSDDIIEDIEDLSAFMATTLKQKGDTILSDGDSKKAAKSYKLLKSTRTVFARCDLRTVATLFNTTLQLIDNYFYDGEVPVLPVNRFERSFAEWCSERETKRDIIKHSKSKTVRQIYSHKPFISVDVDKEQAFVVIPAQKIRNDDYKSTACVEITINGYSMSKDLELYKSFGIYISEELRIPIPNIFDCIDIVVRTEIEKEYRIPQSKYRIFNVAWDSVARFSKGHNYILTKKGIDTKWRDESDLVDFYDGYRDWDYFSANINEKSVFYVGNKPLSIVGEFSLEPIFEDEIKRFSVKDESGNTVKAVWTHPSVSFVVSKAKLSGCVLWVNGQKYIVNNIKGKVCYDWPEDKQKYAVTVLLAGLIENVNGRYSVSLDVPGENNKMLCSYLLMRNFTCTFDRSRYTFSTEAELRISTGGLKVEVSNPEWTVVGSEDIVNCIIPISTVDDSVNLTVVMDEKYMVSVPINVFRYGFSQAFLTSQRADYIWYSDLKDTLYLKIPGATNVSVNLDRNVDVKAFGREISPGLFRVDISDFVNDIKQNGKIRCRYINIEYTDNALRHKALPTIFRNVVIEPYFKLLVDNGIPYIDLDIIGNAPVYLDVKDTTGNEVIKRKLIRSGRTELPELEKDKLYDFYPYMEEEDEFGFGTEKTVLKPLKDLGVIDYNDFTNCRFPISHLVVEEDKLKLVYDYFVNISNKIADDVYEGVLYGLKIDITQRKKKYELRSDGKLKKVSLGKVRLETLKIENELVITLQMYSELEEDWSAPYYDNMTRSLIHCDNRILDQQGQYDRFIWLDEFTSYYSVDVKKIRTMRDRNAI